MGTSKKHKERDREHKKRKKHRSRSRSHTPARSRSRERKGRDKERPSPTEARDRHPPEEKRRRRGSGGGEDEPRSERVQVKTERSAIENAELQQQQSSASGGGANLSLSIEETNKLRIKLGMKPLEVGASEVKGEKESLKDDIHRPAINLAEKKKTEKLRQKLTDTKEKRKVDSKLRKVKALGDSDGEDDAKAWVQKSRHAEEEKKKAELRAKQLQQMDEEFGVSSLVEEEFKPMAAPSYTQNSLKGLKVQHSEGRFETGRTVVLTLADKGVLDEEDDTLINVDIADVEKAEKNVSNKMKGPDYKAYEEPQYDEYGMLIEQKDVLHKYDEEIEGEKKESFVLGRGGTYGAEEEKRMQQIRAELQSSKLTLDVAAPQLVSEYYSKEEMETFKKRSKKVRKIRKKVRADDLLAIVDISGSSGNDLGSRAGHRRTATADRDVGSDNDNAADIKEQQSELVPPAASQTTQAVPSNGAANGSGGTRDKLRLLPAVLSSFLDDSEMLGPEDDLSGIIIDDEAQNELQSALSKAIKLKQKKEVATADKFAEMIAIKREPVTSEVDYGGIVVKSEPATVGENGNIILNVTDEFCRTLGNMPTYGQSGNREENEEELVDFEKELLEQRRQQEEEEEKGGWEEVGIDDRKVEVNVTDEAAILEDEPIVNRGMVATLALAQKKGFIEHEIQKKGKTVRNAEELLAKNYSIEDKRYDDIDEKYRKRGDARDRFGGGSLSEFKDKEGYKPEFRLEYVDDKGRRLNAKEAFRQLSHRFHGKGSGKKKTEKRSKKVEEEELMKQMSSTDTPLNTLSRLIEKQEKEKAAFIVLSGGQKTMTSHTVVK